MRSVLTPLAFLLVLGLTGGCGSDDGNVTVAAGEAASFVGTLALLSADGTFVASYSRPTKP